MKVIDMHCDTVSRLLSLADDNKESNLRENDFHIDLKKMKTGDYLLQNFAVFTMYPSGKTLKDALRQIDKYYLELDKNKDLIRPVYNYKDIIANNENGYMSALLTLEEGQVVENDLGLLRDFYRLGVRMICLTWNFFNGIGYPNFTYDKDNYVTDLLHQTNDKDGLTEFGIAYLRECERLGIIVDVSHLGDKGFWDVCKYSSKPFVASHSNARKVCGVARNLSDEMILALHEKGGVMGMNYCDDFIADDGNGTIERIVDHIDHIKSLGCLDVIGLGSDFDGIPERKEMASCDKLPLLEEALRKRGYDDEEIAKIFYKNVLRVYKDILDK